MSGETRGYGTGEQQTPFMKDVSKVGGVVANVLRKINSAMEVAGAGVGDYFEGTNLMDTAGPRFDKAWGLNNNTPPVAAPVQPVAKQVASPNPPVNTQPVEPVPIMPSVTSPVVVTSTDSAAPLGVGAKPFDADPTGRVQRERDSAYANRVQTKNDIQNDIDRIMSERKLDEMTNWAGRGLGIGQYQSKYGADVLPELIKLKESANRDAATSEQNSITEQVKGAFGLEGQKTVAAAHENAAKFTAAAHQGEGAANREVENRKLQFEIEKFAKSNNLKDPINFLKLAASIAPKKTSFDESGAPTVEPDVNAGLTVLESLGYPAPPGIKSKKPPTIWEQAKGTLSAGMNKPETDMKKLRKDVVGILKTKGFTDSQIEEGLK
jgi:hypothetical protein